MASEMLHDSFVDSDAGVPVVLDRPKSSTRKRKTSGSAVRLPPHSEEPTDEDLLLAYRATGDKEAFEALVRRYKTELFSYLCSYLGKVTDADEAFQTTGLQIHLHCEKFDPGRKVRPWLYTIATNQAIDLQRRNRRHNRVSLDHPSRSAMQINPVEENAACIKTLVVDEHWVPAADQLQGEEEGKAVRAAVDALSEPQRRVIELVYFQGMKYREAADALAIPVGTVKSRLHSAVEKLGIALTGCFPDLASPTAA